MSQVFIPDHDGQEAVVGTSVGYWLGTNDFVSTTDSVAVADFGSMGFPRDWPNVYNSSKELKSLIGKKGKCAGKKVSVVPVAAPEDCTEVAGISLHRLQSFANAERVEKATGMRVVHGWAVFEHLDRPVSAAFMAERFWWNETKDGRWVDFTPRPQSWPELLLAEAKEEDTKVKTTFSKEEKDIAHTLLRDRFGLQLTKIERASEEALPKPSSTTLRKESLPAGLAELVNKVIAGDSEATKQLEDEIRDDEAKAAQLVEHLASPLLDAVKTDARRDGALDILLALTDAAVGTKLPKISNYLIENQAVQKLMPLLKAPAGVAVQERAVAVIGNLCHESHQNQDAIVAAGALPPIVELLAADSEAVAQEAAYAVWNITVGHDLHSAEVVKLGAVPRLVHLLHSSSDIAQENAAGALMHVTTCEQAREHIVNANAIPRLCELLRPQHDPEVKGQAAGAILNLASDCPEHKELIANQGCLANLVAIVKDGKDIAQDYAAGALMNLIRGDSKLAAQAFKDGAVSPLATLLSTSHGHSEALGALANLASGSTERQAAIYKAQVTRKSVAMLNNPDIETRRSAAALLMNMAPHSKIKERIVEAGALKPLAKTLRDEDAAVRERAAGALANLFNDHSKNVLAGFEQAPEMIGALISVLSESGASDDARRQSAHALAMLAAEDAPCDAVWKAGVGPPMLAALKGSVVEAALAIMNLAWRWKEVKEELAAGGAIEALVKMLEVGAGTNKDSIGMSKEYAAGALMNMTASSPENAEKAIAAMPTLAALLREDAEGLQAAEWSAGAIANILGKVKDTAAFTDAISSLAKLLPKVSSTGQPLVVLALAAFTENHAEAVRAALGAKEKKTLRDFRDGGAPELQEYVKTLVQKLGDGFLEKL